jgi:prostamide/prostaglandin F2alpha synthase
VFCRDHAVQLHGAREELDRAGEVVLIGQLTPRHAAHFRRRLELTWPVLADEERTSYKAAGAKVATANELLGPKVVAKGVQASRRSGVVQGRTIGHAAQLGGVLVIRPDGTVAWSHMAEDASDTAGPDEILAALANA